MLVMMMSMPMTVVIVMIVVMMLVRVLVFVMVLVVQVEWFVLESCHHNVDLRRPNAVPIHAIGYKFGSKIKGAGGLLEQFEGDASVHKGSEQHVAANPGETVNVSNAHSQTRTRIRQTSPHSAENFIIGRTAPGVKRLMQLRFVRIASVVSRLRAHR